MGFDRFFESLGQDFRYGVRVLRLNPGFAATAILSLALGVAANTSIFTLTDQILLRLLPVQSIGIRIALGARRGRVIRLVMGEMLAVILLGLAAGVTAAYLSGSYVETQLFGVNAGDWPVFGLSAATLLAAAVVASFLPAWRASRISPVRALRYE